MKLDRNMHADGRGKYALLKLRRLHEIRAWDGGDGEIADQQAVEDALALLQRAGILDWGDTPETEFFVMRIKDRFAYRGLMGYHHGITLEDNADMDYAQEILDLAQRAGPNSPHCRLPD